MFRKINFTKFNLLKTLELILIIFLIIQPIFDLKIFYNSISTLIRVIVISILFLFYYILDKNNKKHFIFVYLLGVFVYIIFHHINALNFNSLVPGNFNYSIIHEFLYFVKMITPFALIYILHNSNLNRTIILKIIKAIVVIISLTIIISNIFVFSYSSYNDEIIKANFFTWFDNSNNYTYQELSSKGLFEYANQISAVLLMFLPFSLITFIGEKNCFNFFVIILNIFSLFLLSTKVAVFGIFIVFIYVIVAYLFNNLILKKQKISFSTLSVVIITIIIYSLILPINPSFMRIDETKAILASSDTVIKENQSIELVDANIEQSLNETESVSNIDYIEQNYRQKEIKKEFITERYPYNYDPEFWINMFNEPRIDRVNYRFIEQAMIKRVLEINNNKLDLFFGITNTRIQNIFNIERDFVVQYYALGIIGLIIIFAPYFILLYIYLYKIFKSKFKYFTTTNAISFITIIMIFCISYYSGNLLNSLSFTIYFTLLYKLLLCEK